MDRASSYVRGGGSGAGFMDKKSIFSKKRGSMLATHSKTKESMFGDTLQKDNKYVESLDRLPDIEENNIQLPTIGAKINSTKEMNLNELKIINNTTSKKPVSALYKILKTVDQYNLTFIMYYRRKYS